MLYAIYPHRNSRSPYALEEKKVSEKISLLILNVRDETQILYGLNFIYNKLASGEFEPELEKVSRDEKLRKISKVIRRVRLAKGTRRNIWYQSVGALIKRGFPAENVDDIFWA